MNAAETLIPVFAMILLGMISRITGLVTPEQKEGAKGLVFNILFPVLIFNAIFTSVIRKEYILVIAYTALMFVCAYVLGLLLRKWHGEQYENVTPFMLPTAEGGNMGLPLFMTIAAPEFMIYPVIFDLAGALFAFIGAPVLVTKKTSGNVSLGTLLKTVFTNSFVIAVIAGLILNLAGVYRMLSASAFAGIYSNTASALTAPVGGVILFTLGYDLKAEREMLKPLLKLACTRVLFYAAVILGFFVLFPSLMAGTEFRKAVILYFMCPTGFAMPMIVSKLCRNEKESSFLSSFISMYMIITLIVYAMLVIA
ncbi:MAG: AEC family transporter [Solobacterium sp.]|nr:AEC family transporter [Solobacterium sp.]